MTLAKLLSGILVLLISVWFMLLAMATLMAARVDTDVVARAVAFVITAGVFGPWMWDDQAALKQWGLIFLLVSIGLLIVGALLVYWGARSTQATGKEVGWRRSRS